MSVVVELVVLLNAVTLLVLTGIVLLREVRQHSAIPVVPANPKIPEPSAAPVIAGDVPTPDQLVAKANAELPEGMTGFFQFVWDDQRHKMVLLPLDEAQELLESKREEEDAEDEEWADRYVNGLPVGPRSRGLTDASER